MIIIMTQNVKEKKGEIKENNKSGIRVKNVKTLNF